LALKNDTVVIATFLHPAWRMMLFSNRFASHVPRIQLLIRRTFDNRNNNLKILEVKLAAPHEKDSQSEPTKNATESNCDSDYASVNKNFNYYNTNPDMVEENTELKRYKKGGFPLEKKGKVLDWWKVSWKIKS
jgi:hypothetical protein